MLYAYSGRPSDGFTELVSASQGRIKKVRRENSKFKPNGKTLINWGNTQLPSHVQGSHVLNKTEFVSGGSNKLTFFQMMTNPVDETSPRVVPWTTQQAKVSEWLQEGYEVVARTSLIGHSGHGIIIVSPGQDIPPAPLYTRYIKKNGEFRVHFINGEVIDIQKKIRDPDREPSSWKVRSHQNGFIFVRTGFEVPGDVLIQARKAHVRSGLDFSAVDVIWNEHKASAFVLEVNSAPGLEGQTAQNYAQAFRRHYDV